MMNVKVSLNVKVSFMITPADLPIVDASQGRRVLIIFNPIAGRRRHKRLTQVIARLTDLHCNVTLRETQHQGDAEGIARRAVFEDFDVIVAAGGDGTINEVVNGLASHKQTPDFQTPRMAIIPLGTANVLAIEIGLDPKNIVQIADTIALGIGRKVHLGVANGRHFLLMAGAGLDARVVEGINPVFKRATGKFAYIFESLRQAMGYDFPALQVRADGITYEGRMAVACKGRHYGGPFIAAPGADLEKPDLELCIMPNKGMAGALRYGLALPFGKLPTLPEIKRISTQSLTITGPRGAPVQADGDIIARLPAEITVANETVRLVVPN
jgi:diacylglycerol kinase (ATP)